MKLKILFTIYLALYMSISAASLDTSVSDDINTLRVILNTFIEKNNDKETFKVWHHLFAKPYSLNTEEGINRYKIFKQKLNKIKSVNSQSLGYRFGLNQFSDLSSEEYRLTYLTRKVNKEEDQLELDSKSDKKSSTIKFLDDYNDDDSNFFKIRNLQDIHP